MVEVGTYTPPLITFGPISPVALIVLLTGLLSSNGQTKGTEVTDERWEQIVSTVDKLEQVVMAGG